MKSVGALLFFLISLSSSAQSRWHDQYRVKKTFEIGDEQTYEVTEFSKAESMLTIRKSEVHSFVRFQIVDTANGGYWMRYSVLNNNIRKQHDSSTYIIAELSAGIEQMVYIKNGYFSFDSLSYHLNREMVKKKLALITADNEYKKRTSLYISMLQSEIDEENDISMLIGPLMLMQMYFGAEVYKKFMVYSKGNTSSLNRPFLFSGQVGNKWESTSKDSTVSLTTIFTGDPVPTARYFRPTYESIVQSMAKKPGRITYPNEMQYPTEYNYKTQPHRSFPLSLSKKNVMYYLWREVSRVEMKKW